MAGNIFEGKNLGGVNPDVVNPDGTYNFQASQRALVDFASPSKGVTNIFSSLIGLSAKNPLGLNVQSVEDMLAQFKTSLLGTRKESELDAKGKSLLQQGQDVANRLTARINTAAQAANSPGAAAQTRRSQSLLG